jgi:hypothetical protein
MQSFFGQINFVKNFTPKFTEIIKPLQNMVRKDVKFKWDDERKDAFDNIKASISRDLVLRSPDFNRDFFLYTFTSDQSLAAVLNLKDDDNNEALMSSMSTNLQGVKLNYPAVDKKAYAVYKAVKHFQSYILKNHTKVIVPHPAFRSLFTQQEMGKRRGNWMAVVQEFDLEIKPAKLVKGQGLCKLAVEAQDQVKKDHGWEKEMELWGGEVTYISPEQDSWYKDLTYLIHQGACPKNLNPRERRAPSLKSAQYRLINSVLFWINYDGVLLRCLEHEDAEKVLK